MNFNTDQLKFADIILRTANGAHPEYFTYKRLDYTWCSDEDKIEVVDYLHMKKIIDNLGLNNNNNSIKLLKTGQHILDKYGSFSTYYKEL